MGSLMTSVKPHTFSREKYKDRQISICKKSFELFPVLCSMKSLNVSKLNSIMKILICIFES